MAQRFGPKIVTDSLVLALDASDNKSAPHNDLPVKDGCVTWLDGADDDVFSYSSGTLVSQWRDKSGNDNHVNQSTTSSQPTRNRTLNSKSVVDFDGSNDSLSSSNSLTLSSGHTMFAVTLTDAFSSDAGLISINNQLSNGITVHTGGLVYFYYGSGGYNTTQGVNVSTSYILTKVWTGATSGNRISYKNGTQGYSTGTMANSNSTGVLRLGQQTTYYNGYIAEVVIYNRELSQDEITKVHNYLQNKWNISVSDAKWYDRTANGLNGSFNGQPIYSETNKGYFYTDGTDDYISTSDSSILDISGDKSLAIWVYLGADSSGCGITGKAHNTEKGMALAYGWNSQGFQNIAWNNRNAPQLSKDSSRDLQKWIYLVGTQDGSTRYIYAVDSQGTRSASDSGGGTHTWVNQHGLIIGRVASGSPSPSGTRFGSLNVYNKALSSAEILQNYNATKGRYL